MSYDEFIGFVNTAASDIVYSANYLKMRDFVQHGNVSTLDHCYYVAYTALQIADRLHLHVNRTNLLRGALLHDYYLYDWHYGVNNKRVSPVHITAMHGFVHAKIAANNAKRDFSLSRKEINIIKRHMFPLTPIPPTCLEAWIVTIADKHCATRERFGKLQFTLDE